MPNSEGPHQFQVRAIDPTANPDPTPAVREFKLRFRGENGAKFKCRLNKRKFRRCKSPYKIKARSKRGRGKKHRIAIKAVDRAGNFGKPARVMFRVIRKKRN